MLGICLGSQIIARAFGGDEPDRRRQRIRLAHGRADGERQRPMRCSRAAGRLSDFPVARRHVFVARRAERLARAMRSPRTRHFASAAPPTASSSISRPTGRCCANGMAAFVDYIAEHHSRLDRALRKRSGAPWACKPMPRVSPSRAPGSNSSRCNAQPGRCRKATLTKLVGIIGRRSGDSVRARHRRRRRTGWN